MSESDDQLM